MGKKSLCIFSACGRARGSGATVEGCTRVHFLRDSDMEGTARDILIPPFDNENVIALFFDGVCDIVHPVAHVFDIHLFTGGPRPVDANH